jgi:hypothetical protein
VFNENDLDRLAMHATVGKTGEQTMDLAEK